MKRVYLSPPDVGAAEEARVVEALRSGWIAPLGPDVDGFEQDMCARLGRRHAVALSSGTAALHLALVSWGVGPGDVVPTSSLTFAATANAITYTGATPYFVDCDPSTGNIDIDLLDSVLHDLLSSGVNVPAIVPVDLLGKCVEHERLGAVAERHGVRVLADAAESLGAHNGAIPAGAFGDAAILSFNGNKIMTTSGGGMLLTDNADLADHVRFLSTQAREPAEHYEHREIGYNYRMSNLLAALGRGQLARLDGMITRRRNLREIYASRFQEAAGVRILGRPGDDGDNCWLTAIIVDPEVAGWSSRDLAAAMTSSNIETRPVWKPMHLQPIYQDRPHSATGHAETLFRQGLTLPSGSSLDGDDLARVLDVLDRFLETR